MKRVIFLVEERSMQMLLDGLLPRLYPTLAFRCVPHEGKQDLERSLPRKLKAWQEPGVRFVVVRDNDGADCRALKQRLVTLCQQAGRTDVLVRLVCQELEAWYLGEPEALAEAFADESLRRLKTSARYRQPDTVMHPFQEVAKRVRGFQKISGARQLALHLTRTRNQSPSFQAFLNGLDRLVATLESAAPQSPERIEPDG